MTKQPIRMVHPSSVTLQVPYPPPPGFVNRAVNLFLSQSKHLCKPVFSSGVYVFQKVSISSLHILPQHYKLLPHFMHTLLLFTPEFLPQFHFWLHCFPTQKVGNLQYTPGSGSIRLYDNNKMVFIYCF